MSAPAAQIVFDDRTDTSDYYRGVQDNVNSLPAPKDGGPTNKTFLKCSANIREIYFNTERRTSRYLTYT